MMITLTGTLICTTLQDVDIVARHLPDHIRLSRAEPGCLWFKVDQSADPLIWTLDEGFVDAAAFAAHQARTRASAWWQATGHIARDFVMGERPDPYT